MSPTVSLIMATFDRKHTLVRAIRSVLKQMFADWELVIVDDGSTDGTRELMTEFDDERIRWVFHERNRGVAAAKNTGFDRARGEWLATLDSDDELVPEALGVLMETVRTHHDALDAVSCNCVDSATGRFAGTGLDRDCFLDIRLSLAKCRGEHWGMFRHRILGKRRFNERIFGMEGILWTVIHEKARWYYVHRGLRIYHTEGDDRISLARFGDRQRDERHYRSLAAMIDDEGEYLELLRDISPASYRRTMFNAAGQFAIEGDRARFERAHAMLRETGERALPLLLRVGLHAGPAIRAGRHLLGGVYLAERAARSLFARRQATARSPDRSETPT